MTKLLFRDANINDLPRLVEMLADDELGSKREKFEEPLPAAYVDAFEAINTDHNHRLVVCEVEEEIAGFFQLSFLPNLSYTGSWRAQIEGVRVAANQRRKGVGRAMIEYAIKQSRQRQCHLLQLTTDKTRPEAVKFYKLLGFVASHDGMKLRL